MCPDLMLQVAQFWDDIDSSFPYFRRKPHFMAIGRREAELLGGCGVDDKMYTKARPIPAFQKLRSCCSVLPLLWSSLVGTAHQLLSGGPCRRLGHVCSAACLIAKECTGGHESMFA
jgi:hypothetical protein